MSNQTARGLHSRTLLSSVVTPSFPLRQTLGQKAETLPDDFPLSRLWVGHGSVAAIVPHPARESSVLRSLVLTTLTSAASGAFFRESPKRRKDYRVTIPVRRLLVYPFAKDSRLRRNLHKQACIPTSSLPRRLVVFCAFRFSKVTRSETRELRTP